jgi:hypothetical protein
VHCTKRKKADAFLEPVIFCCVSEYIMVIPDASLIICITFPDKPGEGMIHISGFNVYYNHFMHWLEQQCDGVMNNTLMLSLRSKAFGCPPGAFSIRTRTLK